MHRLRHTLNQEGQIDKTNGRIYRLRSTDFKPTKAENLSELSAVALVEQLKHPNRTVRQTALRLLGDQKNQVHSQHFSKGYTATIRSSHWSRSGRSIWSGAWTINWRLNA